MFLIVFRGKYTDTGSISADGAIKSVVVENPAHLIHFVLVLFQILKHACNAFPGTIQHGRIEIGSKRVIGGCLVEISDAARQHTFCFRTSREPAIS